MFKVRVVKANGKRFTNKKFKVKDAIGMKKLIIFIFMMGTFLLTGCSVEIDTNSSQSDKLASEADELADKVDEVKLDLKPLESKKELTRNDMQIVDEKIGEVLEKYYEFEEEETSYFVKMVQKVVINELHKKEEVLLSIQEKAGNGELENSDISILVNELSEDVEFSVFK